MKSKPKTYAKIRELFPKSEQFDLVLVGKTLIDYLADMSSICDEKYENQKDLDKRYENPKVKERETHFRKLKEGRVEILRYMSDLADKLENQIESLEECVQECVRLQARRKDEPRK